MNPNRRKDRPSYPQSLLRGFRRGDKHVDQRMDVEIDGFGDVQQFHDVDAATAALDGRDDGLVSAEPVGELRLAETGALPLLHDEVDQAQLSG